MQQVKKTVDKEKQPTPEQIKAAKELRTKEEGNNDLMAYYHSTRANLMKQKYRELHYRVLYLNKLSELYFIENEMKESKEAKSNKDGDSEGRKEV